MVRALDLHSEGSQVQFLLPATLSRLVNSQLVGLQPVGIFNKFEFYSVLNAMTLKVIYLFLFIMQTPTYYGETFSTIICYFFMFAKAKFISVVKLNVKQWGEDKIYLLFIPIC